MAGVVTEHLFDLIAKQVEDHKLVVWYDPECAYARKDWFLSSARFPDRDIFPALETDRFQENDVNDLCFLVYDAISGLV